ncbi:MAG TPA: hypothetical protein IGS53_27555 [Leptolyngbyaceae cyanobacterium M33_DOE_097]|nr:hypothetical protein [Leptolyngbyaceae cyanobacterium M33_DOE_097]
MKEITLPDFIARIPNDENYSISIQPVEYELQKGDNKILVVATYVTLKPFKEPRTSA